MSMMARRSHRPSTRISSAASDGLQAASPIANNSIANNPIAKNPIVNNPSKKSRVESPEKPIKGSTQVKTCTASTSMTEGSSSCRPKREAALRAIPTTFLSNLAALKFKEEQDLKRAIKASLLEAKRSLSNVRQNTSQETKTPQVIESPSVKRRSCPSICSATESSCSGSTGVTGVANDGTSVCIGHRKGKIPPQRKFAQNCHVIPQSCPSTTTSAPSTPMKGSIFAPLTPKNEVYPAITPPTADFLTFLCFRNAPAPFLPKDLDMDRLNQEALKSEETTDKMVTTSPANKKKDPKVSAVKDIKKRRSSTLSK